MRIAPGIHRIGPGLINAYLLEASGEITIVDAGAPGYWNDLPNELAAMNRTFVDIRALVLTHAHIDHVGIAERLRREKGVPVSVHELDAKMARGEAKPQNQKMLGIGFAALRFIRFCAGEGHASRDADPRGRHVATGPRSTYPVRRASSTFRAIGQNDTSATRCRTCSGAESLRTSLSSKVSTCQNC